MSNLSENNRKEYNTYAIGSEHHQTVYLTKGGQNLNQGPIERLNMLKYSIDPCIQIASNVTYKLLDLRYQKKP